MSIAKLDPSTLTPDQRARLAAIQQRLDDATSERSLLAAQAEAERLDPTRLLEEAERETAEVERANALTKKDREATALYRREEQRLGRGLVAKVRTDEGPVVMRSLTREQYREMAKRVEALTKEGRDDEANEVAESYIDGAVAYPSPNEVTTLCERYPLLRGELLTVLRRLGSACADAAGKGD